MAKSAPNGPKPTAPGGSCGKRRRAISLCPTSGSMSAAWVRPHRRAGAALLHGVVRPSFRHSREASTGPGPRASRRGWRHPHARPSRPHGPRGRDLAQCASRQPRRIGPADGPIPRMFTHLNDVDHGWLIVSPRTSTTSICHQQTSPREATSAVTALPSMNTATCRSSWSASMSAALPPPARPPHEGRCPRPAILVPQRTPGGPAAGACPRAVKILRLLTSLS
jgi:hypothetical protein